MLISTGAACRIWTTNTFTYLATDSHTHPCFIYIAQNVQFATFWGSWPPKTGLMKFELSRDLCTVHLPPPLSFIILRLIIQKLSCSQTYKKQSHPQTNKQTNKEIRSKPSTSISYASGEKLFTQNVNRKTVIWLQVADYVWTKFVVPSTGSIIHVGLSVKVKCCPSTADSSPMKLLTNT